MRLVSLALVLALDLAGTAAAQDDPIDRGRTLYLEGIAHFEAQRYADAAQAFLASYDLTRIPASLHSAATALRAGERYGEAMRATRALLRDHPDLDDELRAAANALLDELRSRVGTLELRDLPAVPSLQLRLDGTELEIGATRPVALDVDPGLHRLRIEAPRHRSFEWLGTVAAGARVEVSVQMPPLPRPVSAPRPERPREGGRGSSTPWVVLGVGAAVAVAIGVVLIVILTSDDCPQADRCEEV